MPFLMVQVIFGIVDLKISHFFAVMQFINKLFDIDLDRNDNDNKFIKERRFEVILTSFSSSNDYRPLLNYNSVYK